MARNIEFCIGEFYHIYNRGNDKRITFCDNFDYERFLTLLYLCNQPEPIHTASLKNMDSREIFCLEKGENLVSIGAYCLMPNHFHILIKETTQNGISMFMQKLSTAYTMYFNVKNERTGALFAGRFKARHTKSDIHLKYLLAYIHLNPLKLADPEWKEKQISSLKNMRNFLLNYDYSSYYEYLGHPRSQSAILAPKEFPDYFANPMEFEDFIDYWINFANSDEVEPRKTS